MDKFKIIVVSVLALALIVGAAIWVNSYFFQSSVGLSKHVPVELNEQNLPAYASQLSVVQDLPKDSKILVSFGNINYEVYNGQMRKVDSVNDAEISVYLPEEYIERIGEVGVCQALREANKGNEIGFESSLSDTQLAWKYKGMLKYKSCL